MKKYVSFLVVLLVFQAGVSISLGDQTPDFVYQPDELHEIHWDEVEDRSYFFQYSTDLVEWTYLPTIYVGDGSGQGILAQSSEESFFMRLRWTDESYIGSVYNADFDGDGLASGDELFGSPGSFTQLDPFNPDTDGDGLEDGWEFDHGFDPNNGDEDGNGILDGQDDDDGDGASNEEEQESESDPTDPDDDGSTPEPIEQPVAPITSTQYWRARSYAHSSIEQGLLENGSIHAIYRDDVAKATPMTNPLEKLFTIRDLAPLSTGHAVWVFQADKVEFLSEGEAEQTQEDDGEIEEEALERSTSEFYAISSSFANESHLPDDYSFEGNPTHEELGAQYLQLMKIAPVNEDTSQQVNM